MAAITVQEVDFQGAVITESAAAAGGDTVKNDGRTYIQITNGGGSSITATITAQKSSVVKVGYGDLAIADQDVTIAAGVTKIIGPFPTDRFNNSYGSIEVGYSAVTSVTIGAFKSTQAVR